MPTPNAWTQISAITLSQGYATITFSSIPSTYGTLLLVMSNVCQINGRELGIRFNGDTGTNYRYARLIAEGSSTFTAGTGSGTYGRIGDSNTSFSGNFVTIPNYTNTGLYKVAMTEGTANDNSSTNNRAATYITYWDSTSAITSLSVVNEAGASFDTNSVFSLYGLKA